MTLRPATWPRAALTLARTFGVRGLALRSVHELRRRAGRFRLEPSFGSAPGSGRGPDAGGPVDLAPPESSPFRVDRDRLTSAIADREGALERADRVVAGEYEAYRWDWRPFPEGDGWLRHPVTGAARSGDAPWWEAPHLDPGFGDIKDLWEPARFAWTYDLVRAWLLTGDDRYAATFHARFANWADASPPFRGPHWSCGQESSIRAAALLYAEANLADAPSSSPAAMQRLARTLAATGERVADAIGYAISQRNNHAISEATGLILLGVRFRGRHPEAERWLRRGRRWLDRLVPEQFGPDGWYIQHSFNYMRLALDQCVLAQRSLRSVGEELSDASVARLRAAVELLGWVIDRDTGIVPNHGASDGAFVHPVTLAGYRDFRPTLTAVCASFGLPLPGVPADPEPPAWLGLGTPETRPGPGPGVNTGPSGWAVARVGDTVAFLRAGSYDSRPGHIDALHLDVRVGSREVAVDPGTYAYAGELPWDGRLAGADVHNGPLVDGRSPAERGPRFLWLTWPDARVTEARWEDGVATLVAERPGVVRRRVRLERDSVTIRDVALGADADGIRVGWTLHPDADPGSVETEPAATGPAPHGAAWFCPGYGRKVAAPLIEVRSERPAERVATTIIRTSTGERRS